MSKRIKDLTDQVLAAVIEDADEFVVDRITANKTSRIPSIEVAKMILAKLASGNVSEAELGYLNGVTSSIQDQLDNIESSPWVLSGSNISYTGGTVGIGATAVGSRALKVGGKVDFDIGSSAVFTFDNNGNQPRLFSSTPIQYQSNSGSKQHFFTNQVGGTLTGTLMEVSSTLELNGAKLLHIKNGSNDVLIVGSKTGGGEVEFKDDVLMSGLPTTDIGLATGTLWNDSGTLKIK